MDKQEELIMESEFFYEMHKLKGEYETRNFSEILSIVKIHSGLEQLGIRTTLFDRAPFDMKLPGYSEGNKPGQLLAPIKYLHRFGPNNGTDLCPELSPVFFFAFRNYENKLYEYQDELSKYCLDSDERFKVLSFGDVQLGSAYAVPSKVPDEYVRGRVTKLNASTKMITYWAMDNAYFAECTVSELLMLPKVCISWEMLAVPGIFECDPSPERLEMFANSKEFCIARVTQPKGVSDYLPRKIELVL